MSCRAVILTEIISPYRIPVFNALVENPEIDLKVIFLAETDPDLRQWRVYKDEIRFPYEVLPSWRRRLGKHSVLLNRGLAASLKSFAPEVILCGGYNYLASWTALRWAKRNNARFLLWTESTGSDARSASAITERLKANFLSQCDGFVVPGTSSRAYVRSFRVDDERIYTARNAVDTEFFSAKAAAARANVEVIRERLALPARYFLFVGRLVREKGVFDLVEAYASLSAGTRGKIGLVFVGDGPARPDLTQLIQAKRIDGVRLTGFIHREQLADYYGLADALVFPTCSDVWGLAVNEAMACGLPVICTTAAGCVDDLVRDRWNGRLVSTGDIAELSRAMEELDSDATHRVRMGQNSRERIRAFSPEACAAGMAEAMLSGNRVLQNV
jgi:glycosyltransferase involved in cell wall biosynthesis